jgi:hypothetical protein
MERSGRDSAELYFNDQYFYAFYSNKNIDIYSAKFVNLVQVLAGLTRSWTSLNTMSWPSKARF